MSLSKSRPIFERRLALSLLSGLLMCVTIVQPSQARTVTVGIVQNRVADNVVPPACSWRSVSSATTGNRAYPDANSSSWYTYYYAAQGLFLRISGQYPYARSFSFSIRPLMANDDGSYSINQPVTQYLEDGMVHPDKHNDNPFIVKTSRDAKKRSYTVWIRYIDPTTSGNPTNNIFQGGSSGFGVLTYQVYAPDTGRNALGGVSLPTIDKIVLTNGGNSKVTVHVPLCSSATAATGSTVPAQVVKATSSWHDLDWHNGASQLLAPTQILPSQGVYLARLNNKAGLSVVSFKAPSTATASSSTPFNSQQQVRYWSLCSYALHSGVLAGCLADYQAKVDSSGMVTVVLSDKSQRAAARQGNWLPLGNDSQTLLIYRQLGAASAFKQSLSAASLVSKARSQMGLYYPALQSCDLAHWTGTRCNS